MGTTSRFALLDEELSRPAVNCKLCRIVADLDAADAEYVRAMLARPVAEKGHKHIAEVLRRGGVEVSASKVGDCRAGRHQNPPTA